MANRRSINLYRNGCIPKENEKNALSGPSKHRPSFGQVPSPVASFLGDFNPVRGYAGTLWARTPARILAPLRLSLWAVLGSSVDRCGYGSRDFNS